MLRSSLALLQRNSRRKRDNPTRTGGGKGYVAAFNTGAVYYKRKDFSWGRNTHHLFKKIACNPQVDNNAQPWMKFNHLAGCVRRAPDFDYTFNPREDHVRCAWAKRGRLQLHLLDLNAVFVCFHCGYPVKSQLQIIKEDNWDYRMCYKCYLHVLNNDLQEVI